MVRRMLQSKRSDSERGTEVTAKYRSLSIRGMLAAGAALLLGLAVAGPAAAAAENPSYSTPNQTVTWTDQAGNSYSARALTASEIKAAGLEKYVDMSNLSTAAPSVVGKGALGSAAANGSATAVKRTPGSVSPAASGCWSTWFGYGTFSGLQLWGKTDVNWCGNGTWVTYSTSNCYGYSNYPTYAYLGCSNYPNYGSGWNLYQVKTQWTLCPAYVPIWGSCAYTTYPSEQYQFLGNGKILYNGGS